MKPLVSIIIPVFNGAKYVKFAIQSALDQDYDQIEIIVVNDGSRDEGFTDKIIKSFGNKIRYIKKENGGVASALNAGIAAMKGDFFSWLSHDDLYYKTKISEQVQFFIEISKNFSSEKFVVYSHEDLIDADGKLIKKGRRYKIKTEYINYVLLYKRFLGGCSLLIPRLAFNDTGRFDESLHAIQDYDMWFRMMSKNYRFKYYPKTLSASRRHAEQVSIANESMCLDEKKHFKVIIERMGIDMLQYGNNSLKYSLVYLSFQFKKKGQKDIYLYLFKKSKTCSERLTLINKFKLIYIKLRTIMWNKYLSPLNYYNYMKRILIEIK